MMKNLALLALMTWASFSYAKHPVLQESMGDAENYKVEAPVHEAQRSLAGGKMKKKKAHEEGMKVEEHDEREAEAEVKYWEYQE